MTICVTKKHKTQIVTDVWRRLRRPFILPCAAPCHECEWESIDVDMLGCLVCGDIHLCDVCTCLDVIETGDSVVCAISGAVLRTQVYSSLEFVDTVALTGPVAQSHEDVTVEIEQTVKHMLLSVSSVRQRRSALVRTLVGWCRSIALQSCHACIVSVLCALVREAQKPTFAFVSRQQRQRLTEIAVVDCKRVMLLMIKCGMPIKPAEAKRLAVGVLYLMRHGIHDGTQVVLEKHSEIAHILPSESTLLKTCGVHPRFITEAENRVKFCLRMEKSS